MSPVLQAIADVYGASEYAVGVHSWVDAPRRGSTVPVRYYIAYMARNGDGYSGALSKSSWQVTEQDALDDLRRRFERLLRAFASTENWESGLLLRWSGERLVPQRWMTTITR